MFLGPTTISVSGCTGSGKTTWVKKVLENKDYLFRPPPQKVLYCYGVWQPLFDSMVGVQFHQGIPTDRDKFADGQYNLIVLDDMKEPVIENPQVQQWVMRGSHHKNIAVIYLN